MHRITRLSLSILLVGLLVAPLSASAYGISFGGRVLFVVPCSGGMRQITILPAGRFPISYIWTPFTITKSVGPPVPGGQVYGIADVPFVCFVGGGGFFSSPVPLFGLRMYVVGTSPPGGNIPIFKI
ncbi:MAG: hypothetical protein G01um101456_626 [Parcubacteria group bacterium Gr01-1014_56]|nr:MAG: hypothetical protein G01um101456_626 [Parcubacteria group bacterium Gr01-1014_56]